MAWRQGLLLWIVFCCMQGACSQRPLMYKTQGAPGEEDSESRSITVPDVMVVLQPPFNITLYLLNTTDAIIGWAPPEVYPLHDVDTSDIDRASVYNIQNLENTTPQQQPETNETGVTAASPVNNETQTAGVTESPAPPSSNQTVEEFCHPLTYFLNYTVGYNRTEAALDGDNASMPVMIPFSRFIETHNLTVDTLQNMSVEFSQGCVTEYLVIYFVDASDAGDRFVKQVNVSERPEVQLSSLTPDTNYSMYISAVYVSGHMLNSTLFSFRTRKPTEKTRCVCDWHGMEPRANGGHSCSDNVTRPCTCRSGYRGRFCELCAPGYYRTAPYFPCHRCPCESHRSQDLTCSFKEGFLTCSKCEPGYTGNICHMCQYGYYRYHKYCAPCNCNQNHKKTSPYMCDVVTGACFCDYNTTGFNCERCEEGYEGDAITYKNCTLKASKGVFEVLPQGVIAGICVGIILFICAIVGCVVYWRWNKNPQQRPFWTVELKDDHEGVNFNTVPDSLDDDIQVADTKTALEDQDFYEQQGGAAQSRGGGGSSGKKYARLHEHV